jgi:hypothetical protein
VVVAVAVAMVIVVAGVPVEVESPLRPPEIAGAPVVAGDVIAHRSAEVTVVIVAVNIAMVVVMACARVPVVAPFGMPIVTGAPVVAREFAHLGIRDGCRPTLAKPSPVATMNVVAAQRANVFTRTTTTSNSVSQLCG